MGCRPSGSTVPQILLAKETVGYFFCLEDRALLCRNCDVAIHTINAHVSLHQRFLLTGVKVGLGAADPVASSSMKSLSLEKTPQAAESLSLPGSVPIAANSRYDKVLPVQSARSSDFAPPQLSFAGGSSAEDMRHCKFDEFLGLTDLDEKYNYIDNVSNSHAGLLTLLA